MLKSMQTQTLWRTISNLVQIFLKPEIVSFFSRTKNKIMNNNENYKLPY